MDLGLEGKACVVTGGSRGIGLAIGSALCAEGAHVLLVARDAQALERGAATCAAAGGRAEAAALDLTAADAGERTVAACEAAFGGVDVLVNNAGAGQARTLEELPDEEWQRQWELHVMAPMRLMRSAAPRMAERGGGRIVNVSSSAGKRPSATLDPSYSVTKAAVLSLSRLFADQWAGRGVLVNAVAPGPVEGELWLAPGGLADQIAARQGTDRDAVLEGVRGRTPRGRMGGEEEIAAVVVFLCSARASNVTGAAWSVDGGTVPIIL